MFRSHHHTHIQRLFFPLYFRQLKILQDTHSYQEDIHYLCNNKPHCPNNMLLSVCSLNTGTQHRHYIPYYHVCNPLSRTPDNIPWYLYQKTTGKSIIPFTYIIISAISRRKCVHICTPIRLRIIFDTPISLISIFSISFFKTALDTVFLPHPVKAVIPIQIIIQQLLIFLPYASLRLLFLFF